MTTLHGASVTVVGLDMDPVGQYGYDGSQAQMSFSLQMLCFSQDVLFSRRQVHM